MHTPYNIFTVKIRTQPKLNDIVKSTQFSPKKKKQKLTPIRKNVSLKVYFEGKHQTDQTKSRMKVIFILKGCHVVELNIVITVLQNPRIFLMVIHIFSF